MQAPDDGFKVKLEIFFISMQQIYMVIHRTFYEVFLRSWWVIFFAIISYTLYEQSMKIRNIEYAKLQEHFMDLERQKKAALALKKAFTRNKQSK